MEASHHNDVRGKRHREEGSEEEVVGIVTDGGRWWPIMVLSKDGSI